MCRPKIDRAIKERCIVLRMEAELSEVPFLASAGTLAFGGTDDLGPAIDRKVQQIANLVSEQPPHVLLAYAHHWAAYKMRDVQTDSDIGHEELAALRLTEYLQCVVAAVPPKNLKGQSVSDAAWDEITTAANELFDLVDQYLWANQLSAEQPGDFASFGLEAILSRIWLGTRNRNYQVHIYRYYTDTFVPMGSVIEEIYGISAAHLVEQLKRIHETPKRVNEDLQHAMQRIKLVLPELDFSASKSDPVQLLSEHLPAIEESGAKDAFEILVGTFNGLRLFDVESNCNLPGKLLDDLCWSPGECVDFYASGEMAGWPLKEWPTFTRPLIRINGRAYCFDWVLLADRVGQALKAGVLRRRPKLRDEWRELQTKQAADLAAKYISKLLPGCEIRREVFWDHEGKTFETDLLFSFDDCLVITEVKSGAYSPASPFLDFESHIQAARELGESPVRQAMRFKSALAGSERLELFDGNSKRKRKSIGSIANSDFRCVILSAVTTSPFTEFASQLLQLKSVGIGQGLEPAWVVSVDDLRICSDIFDNPLVFLHYLENRSRAMLNQVLQVNDELDHLSMYLTFNDYDQLVRKEQSTQDIDMFLTFGMRNWQVPGFGTRWFETLSCGRAPPALLQESWRRS